MNKVLIAIALIACTASFSHAAENYSCTPSTVTVSNSAPIAGDSVTLYTVTQNSAATPATHTVSFVIDNSVIGTESVALHPGEPHVVSAAWTASPGEHTVSARTEIPNGTGTTTQVTNSVTLSVAAPPPLSQTERAASSALSALQKGASAAAPAAQKFAGSAFALTERVREDAIKAIEKQLAEKAGGEVLGATDSNVAAAGGVGSRLSKTWDKLLRAALFALRTKILFYGLLAVVAYILLRLAIVWFSERRRSIRARG